MQKLSIIIPCYNEERFIPAVLGTVVAAELPPNLIKEIIIVDDASTDGSLSAIKAGMKDNPNLKLIQHTVNKGKGASIRSGIKASTGDLILIQDADLEYHPKDYHKLLIPVLEGYADVVYGSRFSGEGTRRVLFFFHSIGNKILTFISNFLLV